MVKWTTYACLILLVLLMPNAVLAQAECVNPLPRPATVIYQPFRLVGNGNGIAWSSRDSEGIVQSNDVIWVTENGCIRDEFTVLAVIDDNGEFTSLTIPAEYHLEPVGFCQQNMSTDIRMGLEGTAQYQYGESETFPYDMLETMQNSLFGEIRDVRLMPDDPNALWVISIPYARNEANEWVISAPFYIHEVLLDHFKFDLETGIIQKIDYPYSEIVSPELTEQIEMTDYVFGERSSYGRLVVSPNHDIVYFSPAHGNGSASDIWTIQNNAEPQLVPEPIYQQLPDRYLEWGNDGRLYLAWEFLEGGIGGGNGHVVICLDGSCFLQIDDILEEIGLPPEDFFATTFIVPSPDGSRLALTLENQTEGIVIYDYENESRIIVPSGQEELSRNIFFDRRIPPRWLDNNTLLYFDLDGVQMLSINESFTEYTSTHIDFPYGGFRNWLITPETHALVAWDNFFININCAIYEETS